ncbi:anthocyanidin 3-O-glucosyltransferase 7-like, partial [Asparagus officinalis]|uniref:anthocyanidin 3-O-glucosyltransferase 7-like n=1 Tax=Asparagus officinalis TaxID=4686 RepID=UPI00098E75FE
TAIVLNTFTGLNPDIDAELASLFRNHLPIGPFNLLNNDTMVNYNNGDYECLSWLNRHGPATVTYISFGTTMAPGRSDLEELAHGLEAAGVPFLWSLRGKARDGLPSGFLDRTKGRGLTVAWAPQVRVLAHAAVGAFLTHCGWNSVMEGITNAVPMVCRPFFGEQKANARMVAEGWRIGVAIDSEGVAMREKVVNALKMVLREEEGRRMRERLGEIKKQAEKAVGDGGSSRENFRRVLKVICGGLDG